MTKFTEHVIIADRIIECQRHGRVENSQVTIRVPLLR